MGMGIKSCPHAALLNDDGEKLLHFMGKVCMQFNPMCVMSY